MKLIMTIILTILCTTNMFAQTSKYFEIKTGRYAIELISKNGREIVVKQPVDNWIAPQSHSKLQQDASLFIKEVFGILNEEQLKALKDVKLIVILGPHLKVVSCSFKFPVKQLFDVLNMEDKLYVLSQKYIERDMKSFFRANNEALFQCSGWVIGNLDRLYNFDPANFPK